MKVGFIPVEGGPHFRDAVDQAILAESLGFDSVWLEEHHSIEGHYWPSPILVLTAIAARTEQMTVGTDVVVLPFYQPVRLAEDVATLTGIAGDRFVLGVAIGYREPEFELYNVALDGRGGRFEEQIGLLRRLWAGEHVDHTGRHFRVCGSIQPLPEARVPIWVGGWGPRTIERAARLGDAWVPGPTADMARLIGLQQTYDAAVAAAGGDTAQRPRPLTREVVVAETSAKAWQLAERHLLVNYRDEYGGGWKHPLVGSADATPVDQLGALAKDRFVIGDPDECVREIRRYQDALGIDHLICRLHFPGMSHEMITDELGLIGEAVIPALR
jgi:alkanesulfonate monooxygenase SsuD/methylene tetrahydromethanopterin reductase-like flavin-dependent oxidoreductase (luciferase family)